MRLVNFFSAAYFSAADLTIGLRIWLSASYQSDEKVHFELFPATHMGIDYRYPEATAWLAGRLER